MKYVVRREWAAYLHSPVVSGSWAAWEDMQITSGGHGGTRVSGVTCSIEERCLY